MDLKSFGHLLVGHVIFLTFSDGPQGHFLMFSFFVEYLLAVLFENLKQTVYCKISLCSAYNTNEFIQLIFIIRLASHFYLVSYEKTCHLDV